MHNVALIGAVIAGMFVLLLLNALVIIFFRRRSVQRGGSLRPKLSSIRIIREPNTPNLPMQFPPPWGLSPQSPRGPNPFLHPSDLEKDLGSAAPKGFEAKNPFTIYGRCASGVAVGARNGGDPGRPEMMIASQQSGNGQCVRKVDTRA
jgi:hypothetical protein